MAYLSDNQNNHKFYEDEIYEREIYELAPPPPPYELVNGEVPPPDPRNYGDSIDYINSKHYQDYQQQQKKRDPRWRKVFQIQRAQIEAQLETREERAARKQKNKKQENKEKENKPAGKAVEKPPPNHKPPPQTQKTRFNQRGRCIKTPLYRGGINKRLALLGVGEAKQNYLKLEDGQGSGLPCVGLPTQGSRD